MRRRYDVVNVMKQSEIISILLNREELVSKEEAEEIICGKIMEAKSLEGMENYNISVSITNNENKKWKNDTKDKSLFVKIYYNELDYAITHFGLNDTEVGFFIRLTKYALYESNLLIDEYGEPLNQKRLSEVLNCDRSKMNRMIMSLEKKKCLIRIRKSRDSYFVLNPYLVWGGINIDRRLAELFVTIGYEPMI